MTLHVQHISGNFIRESNSILVVLLSNFAIGIDFVPFDLMHLKAVSSQCVHRIISSFSIIKHMLIGTVHFDVFGLESCGKQLVEVLNSSLSVVHQGNLKPKLNWHGILVEYLDDFIDIAWELILINLQNSTIIGAILLDRD